MTSRNLIFDCLKAIGIICIVLAHTLSKEQTFLYQLRSFDVPLMVLISGSLFWLTSGNKDFNFLVYLKKRIPRLLIPVWCFLAFFFLISYPIALLKGIKYPFTFKEIFYSFTLLIGGIGYVWIVRVFVLIAIISPLIIIFKRLFKNTCFYISSLVITYFVYELIVEVRTKIPAIPIKSLNDFIIQRVFFNLLFDQIIVLLIPYGCIFAFGIIMTQIKKKWLIYTSLAIFSIFAVMGYFYASQAGDFVLTQSYKYPPRLYYMSYSLAMSILLYLIADWICDRHASFLQKVSLDKFITFLSNSSLWIYLWHIFFLYYWKDIFKLIHVSNKLVPEFFVVFLSSLAAIYLQKKLVTASLERLSLKNNFSQFLTTAFLK